MFDVVLDAASTRTGYAAVFEVGRRQLYPDTSNAAKGVDFGPKLVRSPLFKVMGKRPYSNFRIFLGVIRGKANLASEYFIIVNFGYLLKNRK